MRAALGAIAISVVAALPVLLDRPQPVDSADRARELLERTPRLDGVVPELAAHLRAFPASRVSACRDQMLWSRESFWRRQVLSLVHLVVYAPAAEPGLAAVAARQLWADDYFEGALTATVYVEHAGAAYIARLYRFETDHRAGGFNLLERALVRRSARRRLERQMGALRAAIEGRSREALGNPSAVPSYGGRARSDLRSGAGARQ